MPMQPIPRIAMPDRDTFFRDYVAPRRPVIITNLFAGDPIREVATKDDARRLFGDAKLWVQPEYVSAVTEAGEQQPREMTFSSYCAHVRDHPETTLVCAEYEIPARVMSLFRLPEACFAPAGDQPEIFDLPRKYGDHDLLTNMFLGNRGNRAHLHYDGDHRQVLLYQVFGRKRVMLFQPAQGVHLKPAEGLVAFSGVFLEHMTDPEKLAFADAAGGYVATLEPGEAIYMPMLIWHYLDYTDDAMSFNIRFGRNRYGRFLAVDHCHRDYYLQTYAATLGNGGGVHQATVAEVEREYLKPVEGLRRKVEDMRGLFRGLCARVVPEVAVEQYCPPSREAEEVDKILRDIGPTMRYADPMTIARTRPVGPITVVQRRRIDETVRKRGWPAGVLGQVLMNRIGKPSLDAVTQAEAAQILTYLRSPGAEW